MRAIAAALAMLAAVSLTGCDRGDWLGGAERVTREAVDGWDMWETPAVQPHRKADAAAGARDCGGQRRAGFRAGAAAAVRQWILTFATSGRSWSTAASATTATAPTAMAAASSARASRPASRSALPGDKARSDRSLYDHLSNGTDILIPLAPIMTPLDRLLAIERLRDLADAPSVPLFEPRNVEPLR